MKLYTEEEVCKAMMIRENQRIGFTTIMIEHLTPIELPSDEEIEEYVDSAGYWGGWSSEYFEGIIEGAKWMRDKIGGNNEQ